MERSRKKYKKINKTTPTEEIFTPLDNVSSDVKDHIDEVVNDSDMEFYAEEEIYYSSATNTTQIEHNLLIPEAECSCFRKHRGKTNTFKNQSKNKNKATKDIISQKQWQTT